MAQHSPARWRWTASGNYRFSTPGRPATTPCGPTLRCWCAAPTALPPLASAEADPFYNNALARAETRLQPLDVYRPGGPLRRRAAGRPAHAGRSGLVAGGVTLWVGG
ncbi:MAG: hypothetical protein WKG07_16315 [Hymenobacter sp.]